MPLFPQGDNSPIDTYNIKATLDGTELFPVANGGTYATHARLSDIAAYTSGTFSVISNSVTTPPSSPANGAAYIIPSGATGVWAGKTDYVATYVSASHSWSMIAPQAGWLVFVTSVSQAYTYTGSYWAAIPIYSSSGYVGIGVSSPIEPLHVNNTTYPQVLASNQSGWSGIAFRGNNGTDSLIIHFGDSSDSYHEVRFGKWNYALTTWQSNPVVFSMNAPSGSLSLNSSGSLFTCNVSPNMNNIYTLGDSTYRWASVWAVNGTIQTSDAREKTDVADSALGLNFIKNLRPVSYKWKIGGNVEVPDGEHAVKAEPRPGKRTHWGFLAQDVKALADKVGVDFGGHILTDASDPDSQQGLRYDQFIAPLVKAVQEIAARLEALEKKAS